MWAKSYTVGPQQYMPTFFPARSSGTNSSSERERVLDSYKAILKRRKTYGTASERKGQSPTHRLPTDLRLRIIPKARACISCTKRILVVNMGKPTQVGPPGEPSLMRVRSKAEKGAVPRNSMRTAAA